MKNTLKNILSDVNKYERVVSEKSNNLIDESSKLTTYLRELLFDLKKKILQEGFEDEAEEINFFKNIKPQLLGKLIFYNKVFRIETSCPVYNGKMYEAYFTNELEELKQEFSEHIRNSDFYRYYRSGRTDLDREYYMLGKINYAMGLNSFVFEVDSNHSTYVVQEVIKHPIRVYSAIDVVQGKTVSRNVFVLDQFTIADDKVLRIELHEKNGSRLQILEIKNSHLLKSKLIQQENVRKDKERYFERDVK